MPNRDEYWSVERVAGLLGLHPESVRSMARQGRLPGFKAGRSWRFSRAELDAWRRQQRAASGPGTVLPTVLVVDDDEGVCRMLVREVIRYGFGALHATSGTEGLALVRQEVPALILLDLKMPDLNGPQFLEALRSKHPALPVVIVTGYPDGKLMAQAMAYAPVMLLAKPVDRALLERTVRSVIGRPSHAAANG